MRITDLHVKFWRQNLIQQSLHSALVLHDLFESRLMIHVPVGKETYGIIYTGPQKTP